MFTVIFIRGLLAVANAPDLTVNRQSTPAPALAYDARVSRYAKNAVIRRQRFREDISYHEDFI
jgi:hypothetical protein